MRAQGIRAPGWSRALLALAVCGWIPFLGGAESRRPPNIVFILTDNHGAWTLGCYGNPDILTPNIDRLAEEGALFTRALSSNPVCSPTRATFLTGLLPSQHGMHGPLSPVFMMGPQAYNALEEFRTLPRILRDAGYVCGLSGKWHLGANLHPQEGFTYWVTMPVGSTRTFYDAEIIENGEVRIEPTYLTDFWTKRGVAFIEENKDQPFFLYLAYNGPYALGQPLLEPPRNRHASYYADHPLESFPRDTMHPWQLHNRGGHNNQVSRERVAAEVSGVDDGVGEILATLDRLGLTENTLVIFAGDQGWMGGQSGLIGMGDHTWPVGAFERMMQIPLIFRHPERIPAGLQSDIIVSNYDFFPTLLSYLGMATAIPDDHPLIGRDFSSFLKGSRAPWDNVMIYEMAYTRAIREARWKYVARFPSGPYELYDMDADPHERFNLFGQPHLAETQQRLAERLEKTFDRYVDPKYDVWRGGTSKTSHVLHLAPRPPGGARLGP